MSLPEQIRLIARWPARKATVEDCAAKTYSFLLQLAKCDELFAQGWLKCAIARFSRRTGGVETVRGLEPLRLTTDELRNLLLEGRLRRDTDKSVIEHLGFCLGGGLRNISDEETVHVSVTCGAYPDPRILPAANDVWVRLPEDEGPWIARILQPAKLKEIVRITVEIWDPDWARISTGDLELAVYPENPYVGQRVGWFTYISDRYGELPALPPECEVTRVADLGDLIYIKSIDRPTASNEAHVKAIRDVSEILRKAGLLAPTPSGVLPYDEKRNQSW